MFILEDGHLWHLAKTEGLAIKQLLKFVQTNLKIQVYVLITQLLCFVLQYKAQQLCNQWQIDIWCFIYEEDSHKEVSAIKSKMYLARQNFGLTLDLCVI